MTVGRIRGIEDVAEWNLCSGCGACAFAQPGEIEMVDDLDAGRRPLVVRGDRGRPLPTAQALRVCPGVGLEHHTAPPGAMAELRDSWGPVLEVWEGHAGDPDLRFAGSSGGVASALAIHGIERETAHGLLHIRARADAPYLNETVLSTSRAEVLAATGSRYAPASPCDRLDLIEAAPQPCVLIGKPCDVAAADKARRSHPRLDANLGLTIAVFCAGTPTTRGTLEMLEAMGVDDVAALEELRYRGRGWPGDAVATVRNPDGSTTTRHLTYDESWGEILQRHRQWRCYVCADHTGEFADIAVGDPWYRDVGPDEPGSSLILVRTERGRRWFEAARRSGAIVATRVPPTRLPESQPGLLRVRGAVIGRIAMLRSLGLPAPRYRGLPMLATWWRVLGTRGKVRSTFGTLKRIWRRRLFRRRPVRPMAPIDGRASTTVDTEAPGR